MSEIDFIEGTAVDFQPDSIDFQVDFQPPETTPAPHEFPEPARTGEELAYRNLQGAQSVGLGLQQVPPGDAATSFKNMAKEAMTPLMEVGKMIGVTPQTLADAVDTVWNYRSLAGMGEVDWEKMKKDLGELPQREPTTVEKVAAGGQQAVANTLDFFTSPVGIATLGIGAAPAAAQKVVAGAFTVAMAKDVPQQLDELSNAIDSKDPERLSRAVVGLGLTGAFIKQGAEHALKPAPPKLDTLLDTRAVAEQAKESSAPLTAAAVEGLPVTQPLGIAPPGTATLQKVIEFFRAPPESASPPPISPDTSTPLPDFQSRATANEIFSQPFAVERLPVIGRLFGGRARIRNEKDQSVAAWYAERHGIGPAVASAVGEQIRGRINSVFKADEAGNLNVTPATEGQSLKISDVFEALQRDPNSYNLTPEQRAVFDETMRPILDRQKALTEQYDLLEEIEGDRSYFPRIVTERPATDVGKLGGGKRVGAKQFFQKERAFESEAEGWEKGYKYETDVERRIVTGVERLYRAMADKRLATDPVLEGRTRDSLISELREAYAEELGAGEMTEANLIRIADGLQSKGTVYQPGFFGKIFDAETANMLNREFAREQSHILRAVANSNDFLKAIRLGFDVGVGQIQLLPTAFRNPGIWADAQWKSLQAMFRPEVFSEYARQNESVISEMAQMGSSVGRLPEMLAGMTGPTISRIPGLKQAAAPFARQFQTALDVAKVELWKAGRESVRKEEWFKYIQAIESQLQSGRMESVMVPHGRALAERVFFLAPSYYRGHLNLIAGLAESGASGKQMRQAMGSFIAGSTALFVAGAYLAGMPEEEIKKRLNPTNGDFMLWKVPVGERNVNIGFGGIFRSFIRLAGNVAKTSMEHPENWKSLAPDKNPLTRWYRGHSGPTIGLAWDQFSGRDFLGEKTDVEKLPGTVAPLWMQELVSRQQGQPPVTAAELAASFAGLQAFPESTRKQYQSERDELAKKKFGKPFSELKLRDQVVTTKEINKRPSFAVKPQVSQRIVEMSMEAQAERENRLTKAIKDSEAIKAAGLRIRGYDPVLTIGGTRFPLSKEQQERYEQLILAEYDRKLGPWVSSEVFKRIPEANRQKALDARLEAARAIAKAKLIRELNK